METINISRTIRTSLNQDSGSEIIRITDDSGSLGLNPNSKIVSRNRFIKNLKAYASIQSTSEVLLPDFNLEDTETEKLNKVLDVEWGSERKQLNLLIGQTDDWMVLGKTSLLNPSGYPYRIYNLLDIVTDNLAFELSSDIELALQIEDVGYGSLTNQDVVNVYGSYMEEVVVDNYLSEITSIIEFDIDVFNQSTFLLTSDDRRKYVFIQNNGTNDLHISLSAFATGRGMTIKPGGHYEFDTKNVPYFEVISGYSENRTNVLVIEGK